LSGERSLDGVADVLAVALANLCDHLAFGVPDDAGIRTVWALLGPTNV
jgi:hypothetical protein